MVAAAKLTRPPRARTLRLVLDEEPARDRYGTPWPIVHDLEGSYAGGAFDIDVAAEVRSAKAPMFYTRELDALTLPWGPVGVVAGLARGPRDFVASHRRHVAAPTRVFCNPPYRNLDAWVARAFEEVLAGRVEVVVFVLPPGVGTRWRTRLNREARHVIEYEGRIPFVPPRGHSATGTNRQGSIAAIVRAPLHAGRILGR